MRRGWGRVWLVGWTAALLACGVSGLEESSSVAPAPTPEPAPAPSSAPLRITVTDGSVFRWTDGDWVMRMWLTVENVGPSPVHFEIAQLSAEGSSPWMPSCTFPVVVDIPPGSLATGLAAWYVGGANPQPTQLSLRRGDFEHTVSLTMNERASPTRSPGFLRLESPLRGSTWVHDDGDRIVQVPVTLTNAGQAPIITTAHVADAVLPVGPGVAWEAATQLPSPLTILPNQSQTGAVGWYWSGDPGEPRIVRVRLGVIMYEVPVGPPAGPGIAG